MPRILAVVVLYFPEKEIGEIIKSYQNEVDEILIVDNTKNNAGVATALNIGLEKAIKENFDWLLTMDQDSVFEDVNELKRVAFSSDEDVAIVAPVHQTQKARVQSSKFIMTSGNLLRIKAAKEAGPFLDKLFIDSVDNEYCLRLQRLGFKIIRAHRSVLHHNLGKVEGLFKATVHNADRRYYITRNMLYVMSRYPSFILFGLKELTKSFLLIVLIEDQKLAKLHSILHGTLDFVRGKYGVRNAR